MFKVHCHVHESAVLLDWSRIERMYDSDEGPVIDWQCWCGARGRLIAGARSEPRVIEPVVVDLAHTPTPEGVDRSGPDGSDLDAVPT
jgi:hypothetical protein